MKQRKKRRWSGALALALGLSALGLGGAEQNASSVFAQNGSRGETRDWRNSNGEIALRGALDVERTLDEAPSEGAPNRVYFIDESGVSKYYRYRQLSAEDRNWSTKRWTRPRRRLRFRRKSRRRLRQSQTRRPASPRKTPPRKKATSTRFGQNCEKRCWKATANWLTARLKSLRRERKRRRTRCSWQILER